MRQPLAPVSFVLSSDMPPPTGADPDHPAIGRASVAAIGPSSHIYRDVLGMSEQEYERHVASGMIGDTYPESVLGYSTTTTS